MNNKLLNTYRIWWKKPEIWRKESNLIFKIDQYDEEDDNYYCKHKWYDDDYWFDEDYILQNSLQISYYKYLYYKWFK